MRQLCYVVGALLGAVVLSLAYAVAVVIGFALCLLCTPLVLLGLLFTLPIYAVEEARGATRLARLISDLKRDQAKVVTRHESTEGQE